MRRRLATLFALVCGAVLFSTCGGRGDQVGRQGGCSLVEVVERGRSEVLAVAFDRYADGTQELPIGVFDSGIGGLTVLAAILELDAFNNVTHEPGPDGRPDFEEERFVYLGDQANMPYGDYPSEGKTDFLQELILRDAVFLLGQRYWPSATARRPRYDKPPVKAIVIACNTATAYGLETVTAALRRWRLPVPVIGIIDAAADGAVRAIAAPNGRGAVAVLATVGTCQSGGYPHAIARQAEQAGIGPPGVIQHGCLGLASTIEGDPSYIRPAGTAPTVDYRGPAVGNPAALVPRFTSTATMGGRLPRSASLARNDIGRPSMSLRGASATKQSLLYSLRTCEMPY
jgi:glutamate racemase